jgi:glycerol-3-phosphate acyltransferase PlsY
VTGVWGGVLTASIDLLLGITAVLSVSLATDNPWAEVAAGVFAVVGHDWSILIHFAGGIGLAKLGGALLITEPLHALVSAVVIMGLWLTLIRLLHFHRARSTILVMVLVGPLMWLLGASAPAVLLGALGGLVVIIKTIPDWNRKY